MVLFRCCRANCYGGGFFVFCFVFFCGERDRERESEKDRQKLSSGKVLLMGGPGWSVNFSLVSVEARVCDEKWRQAGRGSLVGLNTMQGLSEGVHLWVHHNLDYTPILQWRYQGDCSLKTDKGNSGDPRRRESRPPPWTPPGNAEYRQHHNKVNASTTVTTLPKKTGSQSRTMQCTHDFNKQLTTQDEDPKGTPTIRSQRRITSTVFTKPTNCVGLEGITYEN